MVADKLWKALVQKGKEVIRWEELLFLPFPSDDEIDDDDEYFIPFGLSSSSPDLPTVELPCLIELQASSTLS